MNKTNKSSGVSRENENGFKGSKESIADEMETNKGFVLRTEQP